MKLRYETGEFTREGLFFSVIVEDTDKDPYTFYGKLSYFKGQLNNRKKERCYRDTEQKDRIHTEI